VARMNTACLCAWFRCRISTVFGLTCRGEVRLDRLIGGEASSPFPLEIQRSGAARRAEHLPAGGVGAGQGNAFLRQRAILIHRARSLLQVGSLGVYAPASGDDSVTVNFSDLDVYQATR